MPIGFLKLYTSVDRKELQALRNILGFIPANYALYRLALRHKSVANDINNKGIKNSNERLEFLGDAILGSVVAEVLFKKFPYKDEGFLTEMRSKMVNRQKLNEIALKMGEIMKNMSNNRQVFAITHLPQIAAKGDSQYKVSKETFANNTISKIVKLNTEERIIEIAEMLSGKQITESAMFHAKTLLN